MELLAQMDWITLRVPGVRKKYKKGNHIRKTHIFCKRVLVRFSCFSPILLRFTLPPFWDLIRGFFEACKCWWMSKGGSEHMCEPASSCPLCLDSSEICVVSDWWVFQGTHMRVILSCKWGIDTQVISHDILIQSMVKRRKCLFHQWAWYPSPESHH